MAKSKIEWTHSVYNPVTGCTPISEGCANCYAKRMATRLKGRFGYPADDPFRVTFHPDRLEDPLHWHKPRHIFVSSMGDLFHEAVEDDWIHSILSVAISTYYGDHTYILLTKRPERMMQFKKYFTSKRIWLGVTAENQARADERIPVLLEIPARMKFVSLEPLLHPINLEDYLNGYGDGDHIGWVIAGCESGPGRRPAKIQWFRDIKNQCVEAGVPFFLKQIATEPPRMAGCEVGLPIWYERFESKLIKMPSLDGRVWDQLPG